MSKTYAVRYTVTTADGRGPFWGTCSKWAGDFSPDDKITQQVVQVTNPVMDYCGYCKGSHVKVPSPLI